MKKSALLIGELNMVRLLADSLIKKQYKVTAIISDYKECLIMAENDSVTVINGDGTKPSILEEAKAQNNNVIFALLSNDADNLVAGELCKKKFHIKKVVALVSDSKKMEFFYKMGFDSVVCVSSTIMCNIE